MPSRCLLDTFCCHFTHHPQAKCKCGAGERFPLGTMSDHQVSCSWQSYVRVPQMVSGTANRAVYLGQAVGVQLYFLQCLGLFGTMSSPSHRSAQSWGGSEVALMFCCSSRFRGQGRTLSTRQPTVWLFSRTYITCRSFRAPIDRDESGFPQDKTEPPKCKSSPILMQ